MSVTLARSVLILAALLLGLAPVHVLVRDICTPAAAALHAKGSGCDCEASGCQSGAAVFCGQCLSAVSLAVDSPDLSHPVVRSARTFVHDSGFGRTLEPPVPPPEQAA